MDCTNDQWIFDLAAKHESRPDGLYAPVIFDSYGLLEFATELLAARPVKLEDIEQYRQQMAGISCAAHGHWKECDGVHPDYDAVPLRDVAKLYAKYEALKAESTT